MAGWRDGQAVFDRRSQFWVTANGNALDICILEWCKLFGSRDEEHYWHLLVDDVAEFKSAMLRTVGESEMEFVDLWQDVKCYRDSFVAHLDQHNIAHIPYVSRTLPYVAFLFDHIRAELQQAEIPADLMSVYNRFLDEVRLCYDNVPRV